MQLIRSNKIIVIIKKTEVTWVDTALGNTTGVKINASISSNTSSYLHLKISKTVIRYPEDMGSYQCSVYAEGKGFVTSFSQTVNLTGTTMNNHRNFSPVALNFPRFESRKTFDVICVKIQSLITQTEPATILHCSIFDFAPHKPLADFTENSVKWWRSLASKMSCAPCILTF